MRSVNQKMDEKLSKKKENSEQINHHRPFLVQSFYLIFIILSSLLVPLSFLLLARLSNAHYQISLALINPPKSFINSPFLYTYPTLLHGLVFLISFATLINVLTRRISATNELPRPIYKPSIIVSYVFLCTLLVCVGLAIEATFDVGVMDAKLAINSGVSTARKLVFFLGLNETMVHWCRMIVRPMMAYSIYGGATSVESSVERWALTASFAAFSWVLLRVEVEALVVLVVAKRKMLMNLVWGDFLGLGLYYLTILIGWTRIINVIKWVFNNVFCKRVIDHGFRSNIEGIKKSEDIV